MRELQTEKKPHSTTTAPAEQSLKYYGTEHKAASAPPVNQEVFQSPGQPFNAHGRRFFEPNFEYNFSQLEINAQNGHKFQTALSISQADDIFEREAERVAEAIMRSPAISGQQAKKASPEKFEKAPLMLQRKEIKPVRIEEGAEKGGLQAAKAPGWAAPIADRLIYETKSGSYQDTGTSKCYTEAEMNKQRRMAEKHIAWYSKLLGYLEETAKKGIDPSADVADIIHKAWIKITGSKLVVGGGMESRESGICAMSIEPDPNPFLVFPLWLHESLHQQTCTTTYNKALQAIRQGRRDISSFEMGLAAKETAKTYANAKFVLEDEIKAYRDVSSNILSELQTFQKMQEKNAAASRKETGRQKKLRRKTINDREPKIASPTVYEVLRSPGWPLDAGTRAFFEQRLGYDFSRVRVHTDERAARSAQEVNAVAYTVGRDISFDSGQFAPATEAGRKLLAHELVHVVQNEIYNTAPDRLQRQALPSRLAAGKQAAMSESGPKDLSDEQLEDHVKQLYEELRSSGLLREPSLRLDQAIKELITRATKRARGLGERELFLASNAFRRRFLAAAPGSGESMVSDLYWHIYSVENLRCQRLAYMGFPAEKVRAFQAAAPQAVRHGDQQCLETFIHHLEVLYSKEELDSIASIAFLRHVLAVNNIFKQLEARSPNGVQEQTIIKRAAALGISEDQTRAALQTMQAQNVVTWRNRRWFSTGEPFRGLLDTAMEAFTTERQKQIDTELQGLELEVPVKPMQGIILKTVGKEETKASQDLAQQIFNAVEEYLRPVRPGHFFFALSLHQGYHSVMLHAEITPDFKLKLFWKDQQHGGLERSCATKAMLAAEIKDFWPSYWPEFSTLWPLLPGQRLGTASESE
jgi:hypothetical protein